MVEVHIFLKCSEWFSTQHFQLKYSFKVRTGKVCHWGARIYHYVKYPFLNFTFRESRVTHAPHYQDNLAGAIIRLAMCWVINLINTMHAIKAGEDVLGLVRNFPQHFARWLMMPHFIQCSLTALGLGIGLVEMLRALQQKQTMLMLEHRNWFRLELVLKWLVLQIVWSLPLDAFFKRHSKHQNLIKGMFGGGGQHLWDCFIVHI